MSCLSILNERRVPDSAVALTRRSANDERDVAMSATKITSKRVEGVLVTSQLLDVPRMALRRVQAIVRAVAEVGCQRVRVELVHKHGCKARILQSQGDPSATCEKIHYRLDLGPPSVTGHQPRANTPNSPGADRRPLGGPHPRMLARPSAYWLFMWTKCRFHPIGCVEDALVLPDSKH